MHVLLHGLLFFSTKASSYSRKKSIRSQNIGVRRKVSVEPDNRKSSKAIARRSLLSFAAIAAGSLLAFRALNLDFLDAEDSPSSEKETLPSTDSNIPSVDTADPRMIQSLTRAQSTGGVRREYKDAFLAANVKAVVPLVGLKTSNIPWLAVSIVSSTRQLQIVSPYADTPAYVIDVPNSNRGGIESLIWDQSSQLLYLSTNGILLVWDAKIPKSLRTLGRVANATTLYELKIDSLGNVWGGTHPLGAPFRYDKQTGEIRVFERLAADTDYVRQLVIDRQDQVWLGTGSRNPRIFVHTISEPTKRIEIQLPKRMLSGFITSLSLVGNNLAVSVSDTTEQLLMDVVKKRWVGNIERTWARRRVSVGLNASEQSHFFSVTDNILYATDTSTLKDSALGRVSGKRPLSLMATPQQVQVVSRESHGIKIELFNISQKKVASIRRISLESGALGIHSLLGTTDGKIFLGAFMGTGLAVIDPRGGKSWHSPEAGNLINQIEGMIQFDSDRFYIGSYGYADIISLDSRMKNSPEGYKRLSRLDARYNQSRPFAWTKNSRFVFFGTVPDYGISGGVLGMIDANTNQIQWVLDGDGSGFVKSHSIIGLTADEKFVYGTTSVRNGYGLPDTKGSARVFKMEISTKKIFWMVEPVTDTGALYSPQLIHGWLLCADAEGVNVIDVLTGDLIKRHRVTETDNSEIRAGWARADLVVVGDQRIVHSAIGVTTVIDLVAGSYSLISGPTGERRFGSRLAVTPDGKVFSAVDGTSLAELDLEPRS